MVDIVDSKVRSQIMANVKNKNTKPEIMIRHALHRIGFRYRLHVKDLPGKPDMVFSRYHAVIQINGCFWHAHGCKKSKLPQTRIEFWKSKIETNKCRDRLNISKLLDQGWRVLVWWECNTKNLESFNVALVKAVLWLHSNEQYMEID